MSYKEMDTKIITIFVVLSLIIHGLIIYVIAKTKREAGLSLDQGIDNVEVVDTDMSDGLEEYPLPVAPPQQRKKPVKPIAKNKLPPKNTRPAHNTQADQVKTTPLHPKQIESATQAKIEDMGRQEETITANRDLPQNETIQGQSPEGDEIKADQAKASDMVTGADEVNASDMIAESDETKTSELVKTLDQTEVLETAENANQAEAPKTVQGTGVQEESAVPQVQPPLPQIKPSVSQAATTGTGSTTQQETQEVENVAQQGVGSATQQQGTQPVESVAKGPPNSTATQKEGVSKGQDVAMALPEKSQSSGGSGQALGGKDIPVYQKKQLDMIRPSSITYPKISRQRKEVGTAKLRVVFNANGIPQQTILVKSTGSRSLDQAAINGIKTLRFKPLGHAFIYEVPVHFQLEFNDQQLNHFVNFNRDGSFKAESSP